MAILGFLIVLALIITNIIFFNMYLSARLRLHNIKRIYNDLHGETGFDNVIKVLTKELQAMGLDVLDFYRKDREQKLLVGANSSLPLITEGSAVNAFYTTKIQRSDDRYPTDCAAMKSLDEKNMAFIPIHMQREGQCWKLNHCDNRHCKCHSRNNRPCWLESGKNYRDAILPTFDQKTAKCLNCHVFLPIGVFAVRNTRTRSLAKGLRFLQNFSGLFKDAVMYERAKTAATFDGLTRLYNKQTFLTQLTELIKISRRYGQELNLCMFDIDHFKKFNDTFGHQTGDFVLRHLAEIVSSAVRESDIVARYGGEEFAIVFPVTAKEVAIDVADKVRRTVEQSVFSCSQGDLKVTISMGVACVLKDEAFTHEELIRKADISLYHSKENGRNRVTAFRAGMKDMPQKKDSGTQDDTHAPQSKTPPPMRADAAELASPPQAEDPPEQTRRQPPKKPSTGKAPPRDDEAEIATVGEL